MKTRDGWGFFCSLRKKRRGEVISKIKKGNSEQKIQEGRELSFSFFLVVLRKGFGFLSKELEACVPFLFYLVFCSWSIEETKVVNLFVNMAFVFYYEG